MVEQKTPTLEELRAIEAEALRDYNWAAGNGTADERYVAFQRWAEARHRAQVAAEAEE